ncbi:MAG: DUF3341 domain-containing protein [Gammaproteobacteria bacterium]|nr:DUF3341 domain-containing protein [Gammaproteobacteria bacterium]
MAKNIMALFQYQDDFLNAARKLKASGFDRISLMTPIPMHDAEKIAGLDKSPVRRFSLIGAILGGLSGFAMATACALVFILPTGGRAIITFPPFLVISYEMTILIGVLSTLLGFHIVSGLPAWRDKPYRMETSIDRFSLVVGFDPDDDPALAEKIMRDAGAEKIIQVEKPE